MSYTDDERIRAKRRALYILAQRDHSKKELYDKLIKNYPPDLCETVVGLMCEHDLINEEKYTEKLYRAYINKGWGKSKIRFELRRKGLPDSLISQQEEEYDTEDFIDEIMHLVDKKYAGKLDFSDYKSVQRVTAALARRGFAYDDIKLALSRIKDGDYDEYDENEDYDE